MSLETCLGGNVLQVAYFLRHDMIKASDYISLVLESNIAFIFSSKFLSTAVAITLSVDFYPSLL